MSSPIAGIAGVIAAALAAAALPAQAGNAAVTVFARGQHDYHTFRIPAVVRAGDGALLAFAEGRVRSAGDSGDIDLVLRRSTDAGRTWGELQVLVDAQDGVAGNPCPVVDAASGDVVLLFVQQPGGCSEHTIRRGTAGARTPMVMRSADAGATWSEPAPLTAADRDDWRWYATGPCHAIQLRHGEHAGRLVAPANHSDSGGAGNDRFGAHLLLSDDGGRTWRIGAVDDTHVGDDALNPSETTVAELPDGRIAVNTRDHHGDSPATRAATWSADGGESFTAPFAPQPDLVGPVCQGALLATGDALWFAGPSDPKARNRLAIRRSDDGGATWTEHAVLHDGPAAYADLVDLAGPGARDGAATLGCLFEAAGYREIRFATFTATR